MNSQKTSPVLLPIASDLLPTKTNVVPLRTATKTARTEAPARLTKANVGKLVCPAGQTEVFLWDSEIKGLGLRIYPAIYR